MDVDGAELFVTIARVALAECGPPEPCSTYVDVVAQAVAMEPPPFCTDAYAEIYRAASADPRWMAISLIANARREGQGATDLWSMAARSLDAEEQQLIKRHAVDESRHAMAYLKLLDLSFPGATAASFRGELDSVSPGYTMAQEPHAVAGSLYAKPSTIDDFVQMNIAEIRTTVHHLMQRAALETHCPAATLPKVRAVLSALLLDELGHVAYTAALIERKAAALGPGGAHRLYGRRLRDFNAITRRELGRATPAPA